MADNTNPIPDTTPVSFVEGPTLMVPEALAKEADRRAREIFDHEAAFSKPFNECLGMIYMVGVRAGIDAQSKSMR